MARVRISRPASPRPDDDAETAAENRRQEGHGLSTKVGESRRRGNQQGAWGPNQSGSATPTGNASAPNDQPTRRSQLAKRLGKYRLSFERILAFGIIVTAWESLALVREGLAFFISRPSDIAGRLVEWTITSNELVFHLQATLQHMFFGFLLGASAGILAGIVLGLAPHLGAVLDPFITGLYSLPRIALAPLFVLWFGIGPLMKIALAGTIVFFLVFWNTYAGIRARDEELLDVLRVMGASTSEVVTRVLLPGSLSYIYVGLKISVPYALVGAVVGEMIASNRGMGWLLLATAGQFDVAGLFAGLVTLMLVASVFNEVLGRTERRFMKWRLD